ncbi:MAG: SPOR domain-containing protein [Bacteroidota bacterium]
MKLVQTCIVLTAFCFCTFGSLQAQSKKKLKEEVQQLTEENRRLDAENSQLERQTSALVEENRRFIEQNTQLRSQVTQLQRDFDDVSTRYTALSAEHDALKGSMASTNPYGTGSTRDNSTYAPDPTDTRDCARKQGTLRPNTSYTERFNPLNSQGWGLQIYAFRNLCQAVEKAAEFRKQYKLYKTYIRVKEVNGTRIYAVIYGSLREKDQAETYKNNFRKIAKDEGGKNAFLVQH